jgi:plasmid stability protein
MSLQLSLVLKRKFLAGALATEQEQDGGKVAMGQGRELERELEREPARVLRKE